MKKQRGITLIALIITIIVMLILAGIGLNLTIGEKGIFKTAQNSSEEFNIENIKEKVNLEILDLASQKIANGEKLTIEQALIEIEERKTFEEIDLQEQTGICDGYIIKLGYDDNGNVVILGLEKDKQVRIQVTLTPNGYTNGKIEARISVKSKNLKVSNVEVPEGLVKKDEETYEIVKNGIYLIKAKLDNGQTVEKEIKISTIDKLVPKSFNPTAEITETGFIINAKTEDEEENEENVKSGIEHYEYFVNDEKQEDKEMKDLVNGNYKVYVVAYDKAGNYTKSEEIEVKISRKVSIIATGGSYGLAIDKSDKLWGWGYNSYGQLGNNLTATALSPVLIENEINFKDISAGVDYTIAIDENDNLWAWGNNKYGKLGIESTTLKSIIPTKLRTEVKFKKISAGQYHSLAIDENGDIWGWGYNNHGQLGFVSTGSNYENKPIKIETEVKFKEIVAGQYHSLAIDESGNLWSWGYNNNGQLGDGSETKRSIPMKIETEVKFKEIAIGNGSDYNLAIDESGNLWSWGYGTNGQLGNGVTKRLKPGIIQSEVKAQKVQAGRYHCVVIDENGNLWSWGDGKQGQLGTGTTTSALNPKKIDTNVKFIEIKTGISHTLAIDENGSLWGWGINTDAELGIANHGLVLIPTQIEI